MIRFNVEGVPSTLATLLHAWKGRVEVVDRFGPGDVNVEMLNEYADAFLDAVEDAGLTHVML
jgi:hypothetical protein